MHIRDSTYRRTWSIWWCSHRWSRVWFIFPPLLKACQLRSRRWRCLSTKIDSHRQILQRRTLEGIVTVIRAHQWANTMQLQRKHWTSYHKLLQRRHSQALPSESRQASNRGRRAKCIWRRFGKLRRARKTTTQLRQKLWKGSSSLYRLIAAQSSSLVP